MFADEEKDVEEQPVEEPSEEESTEEAEGIAPTVVMSGREMQESIGDGSVEDEEKEEKPVEPSSSPTASEGWKTARIPAAKPAQPAAAKPAAPAPPAKAEMKAAAAEASPSMAAADQKKSAGSFLARFGIEDPNTQRWVLIGGIVVLALCCLCSCLGIIFGVLPQMGGTSLF